MFRNLLLRRKLTLIMTLTSGATLFIASTAWLSYDRIKFHSSIIDDLSIMSDVIGANNTAAISFGDVEGVEEDLNSLNLRKGILGAFVFTPDAEVFAAFRRDITSPESVGYRREGHFYEEDCLLVYRPIVHDGEELGTVCIQMDMAVIHDRQTLLFQIMGVVFLVSSLLAFLLSSVLQRVISKPVLHLTETAGTVSKSRDYSIRAVKRSNDELGFLTESFNRMLDQIQNRDAELERHRNTLEDEVERRTSELRNAMQETERAVAAKSEFFSKMSHEIRTPMNGVLGMTDLLFDTDLTDTQQSYAQIIRNSGESLLSIINDILDFSKIEAGKLQMESIDFELTNTVEEVVGLLAGSARKKGLDLVCWFPQDTPKVVMGDPTRVRQVITNLIGNAIKFTQEGCVSVRVEHEAETEKDVTLRISIQDTGIGVNKESKEWLFQSFSQADASTTRKFGGTGLGLTISRQLVELMGGRIGVDSEVGVGSTFWFSVPFEKAADHQENCFVWPENVERPRILVAETSAAVREMLHLQFDAWGLEQESVADGDRAIWALNKGVEQKNPFGLLLSCGQGLKGSSLEEISKAVRGIPELCKMPIVRMDWNLGDKDTANEQGVNALLLKPVRPSKLFETIVRSLSADSFEKEEVKAAEKAKQVETEVIRHDLRILLVEDHKANQMLAMKFLDKAGFTCDLATNGKEALDAYRKKTYDLILMDCQMPEMDGYEATRRIRSYEVKRGTGRRNRIRIVAMTANVLKEDRERCFEAGMDDFIGKPIKRQVLVDTLNALSKEKSSRQAVRRRAEDKPPVASRPVKTARESEPFNASDLLQRFSGRRVELEQAAAKFERESAECLNKLKAYSGSRKLSSLATSSGEFREASALVSSQELERFAGELERLALASDLKGVAHCLEKMEAELLRCTQFLPEVLARATD